MRRTAVLIAVVFALGASPALGANTTTVHVGGASLAFTQADVTIAAGDSIHWTWDGTGHSVTSGSHPPSGNGAFDSGVQSIGSTFDQTFAHPGVYHYFCKIHYFYGMVGTITVTGGPDPLPSAAFSPPASIQAGQPVQFDASASSTSDGDTIDSYTWDFGDGTQDVTFSPVVAHTFATAGTPTVQLTVADSGSQSASSSRQVTVQAPSTPPPTTTTPPSGTPTPPSGTPPPRNTLVVPRITGPLLRSSSFCVRKTRRCRHPGTGLTFTLSARARVSLVVSQGRHRLQHATLNGHPGRNIFSFAGAGLKPGSYTLALTPAGGRAVRIAFVVLAR